MSLLWLTWSMASQVHAQTPPNPAEVARLEEELLRLAQRNTWAGVERTYRRLMELGATLPAQDHYLGAQAAMSRGDTLLGWHRLRRAERADPGVDSIQREAHESAARELASIEERYALVSIYAGAGAVPALFRDAMPFAQQERDAVIAAQRAVREARAFRGLLPVGAYALDGVKFEVVSQGSAVGSYLVVNAGQR